MGKSFLPAETLSLYKCVRAFIIAAMKKDAKRATPPKTAPRSAKIAAKTVNEYFVAVPEPARSTLKKVRASIRAAIPGKCDEVISYGMPGFKYQGKVLVWIAAFSGHCSFFPMGSSVMKPLAKELGGYKTSKGTIQFPLDKPLPAALVKKIVKERMAQNEAKAGKNA
jgi:uncharacterized protein YdhG (YjbR/CyaY superfamily)